MRELTIHCDRCGCEVMPRQRISYIVNAGRFRQLVHDKQVDLCIPCGQELQAWLLAGRPPETDASRQATPEPASDGYNF